MRIFLTGASGFVGRHLARALAAEHELHLLPPRPAGDLREPLDPRLLPGNVDVVIHAASLVGATDAPREQYIQTNVGGTTHAARAALAMNARRFILLSTGGVYPPSNEPLTETSPVAPQGDYAVSKLQAEDAAREFRSDLTVQILRLFFPYGPGQSRERLIPRLIARITRGEAVFEGPRLNPIYVSDLVELIRLILEVDHDLVVNLAGPQIVSIRSLAEQIGVLVGASPLIVPPSGTPDSWVADIARAVRLTGYVPQVSVHEGLKRTIESRA